MDVKIIIDENQTEPSLVIYTDRITPEIQAMVDKLRSDHNKQLLGYTGGEIFIIDPSAITRIHTEGNKVVLFKPTFLLIVPFSLRLM